MERLFIYGTLAPGQANYSVMADIPGKWEPATLKGKLLNEGWGSSMGCPGIVPTEDGEDVNGHLFSSEHLAEHWAILDEFEGKGYRRTSVRVKTESNVVVEAYVYALNNAN